MQSPLTGHTPQRPRSHSSLGPLQVPTTSTCAWRHRSHSPGCCLKSPAADINSCQHLHLRPGSNAGKCPIRHAPPKQPHIQHGTLLVLRHHRPLADTTDTGIFLYLRNFGQDLLQDSVLLFQSCDRCKPCSWLSPRIVRNLHKLYLSYISC